MLIRASLAILLLIAGSRAFAATQIPTDIIAGTDLVSGRELSFDVSKSKLGTVVVFLSANCPCSNSHEQILKNLAAEYPEFKFVGVHSNADEEPGPAREHFKKAGFTFPILQDNDDKLADEFKAFKTPHAFVINKNGEILYAGGVTDTHDAPKARIQFLKDALAAVKAGKKPEREEGRTLGCAIARHH